MRCFKNWFQEAIDSGLEQPRAMSVATLDLDGSPDSRMMLFKGINAGGFVFYTNMETPKARGLLRDPRAALCFYWAKIDKQVRVRGRATVVSDEEADVYFAARPRLSQISAWASKQSQRMRGYFELEAELAKTAFRFGVAEIPLEEHKKILEFQKVRQVSWPKAQAVWPFLLPRILRTSRAI